MFMPVQHALFLRNFVLYFSECVTRCVIVEFCVIFFCILVLCNFVLYIFVCGTRSGIVEFLVIFFSVWNVLWYCGTLC